MGRATPMGSPPLQVRVLYYPYYSESELPRGGTTPLSLVINLNLTRAAEFILRGVQLQANGFPIPVAAELNANDCARD